MKALLSFALGLLALSVTGVAQLDRILAPVSAENADAAVATKSTPSDSSQPVRRDPRLLTGDDLLPIFEKQLAEHFAINGVLKVGLVRPWQTMKLPDEDFELTITDFPGEGVSSSFFVRCKIVSGGVKLGEWQVALRAQLWQEVWVATGRIDRGQALDRSILTAQKVDVLRERETLLAADIDPTLYEIVQGVGSGRAVAKRDVVERPIVRKGQVIEVTASQGLLAVSMKAQALESGVANALIKMRNLESRKEFTAQIINESHVQVHF